jgi:hypothetical protein
MTQHLLISGDSASPSDHAQPCPPRLSFIAGYLRSTGYPFHGSDDMLTGLHDLEAADQVGSQVPVLSFSDCGINPWSIEQEQENEFKWNRNQRRPIPKMTKIR